MTTILLTTLNVVGVLVGYIITMLLARQLANDEFEQYIGAIATLGLLASLGEAGFGKYGLRIVPVFVAGTQPSPLRSYLRFALGGTLLMSLLVGLGVAMIQAPMLETHQRNVMFLAIVSLPVVAAAGVTIDLLMALQMATRATLVSRVLVPLTTLWLVGITTIEMGITPFRAVLCFCAGSTVGLIVGMLLLIGRSRHYANKSTDTSVLSTWARDSFSYLVFYALIAWLFRATLVVAYHVPHQGHQVAILAPAFETGCLILLLAKATDKYFQPMIALGLETSQWRRLTEMRRTRLWVISSGVLIFLATVFFAGDEILMLYGERFAASYIPLCIVAFGSSVWTLFSLSPTFLLFAGERRTLLSLLCIHAVSLVVLLVLFFEAFGAAGAAAAYSISISSFAISNLLFANRHFRKLRSRSMSRRKQGRGQLSSRREPRPS
ncbi:membrane protein [Rhodopirellula maiorica SM1]|uniref:Membrane protein n=1 Tax=Rhodopirellula maiorica SM1 TaxID=1265738 RepID=M5RXT8_9BACT|nr:membrane protein [Rhodopirellula maiorica SM1]